MPFSNLDTAAIARSLSQLEEKKSDHVEAFFECLERVELPPPGESPGICAHFEHGFAIRLLRNGQVWMAARDGIDTPQFRQTVREVARAVPQAVYPDPKLAVASPMAAVAADELARFSRQLDRAIRERHAGFPLELRLVRHRRWIQAVGTRLIAAPQSESYYSCEATLPWGRSGGLLTDLSADVVERFADSLVQRFRSRELAAPKVARSAAVFGPGAAAVLFHEVVAHALESDTLALGGRPEAAVGLELGVPELSVLDDPASGPEGVRRETDDEGMPVVRRWLLRAGKIEQPLADLRWARSSEGLTPGAARRANRFAPPNPRSTHLEVVPGSASRDELFTLAGRGLFVSEIDAGSLDPLTGRFQLRAPFAWLFEGTSLVEPVGRCVLRGGVAELLSSVVAVGDDSLCAGAGWCAKGGQLLPVWATTPSLLVSSVRIAA